MTAREITHGSLFSGVGGFDLGFARAGIKTLWDVEIDPYCQVELKKNFPETEIFGDIREVGKHNLRAVDIISGGFPCQPFSNAGKRGGETDNRYLWPEMLRVIQELRPAWVVCENVAGLESMGFAIEDVKVAGRSITSYADQDHYEGIYTLKERMYLDFICDQLEESGYDVQPFNIPACGVGAPHLRRRIWIVAHSRCEHGEQGHASGAEFDATKRSARAIQPESGSEGCGGSLSNASSGNDRGRDAGAPGRQISESGKSSGSENVADSQNANRGRPDGTNNARGRDSETRRCDIGGSGLQYWAAEPNLGELVDGLPAELAAQFAGRDLPRDMPIPRVAKGVPDRADKLKGFGNAVIPDIPEIFGFIIAEIINQGERDAT